MNGDWFRQADAALKAAGIHQPCLVLDLDLLDANVAAVRAALAPGLALRIVDKSLPCPRLVERIAAAFGTRRIMTFHAPVARAMLAAFPDAELLFGKPMPAALAASMLDELPEAAARRIVWLVDTPERLAQYGAVAAARGQTLRFCFEVDIGLHRGGFPTPEALGDALAGLERHPLLACEGMMAYEAHIGHIPGWLGGPEGARRRSLSLFRRYLALLGEDRRRIVNLGGSSTALLYGGDLGANEVAMGSAFVKPSDFDVPSLAALRPAIFIAAPVLKVVEAELPGLDRRSRLAQALGLLPRRGLYLYGGKWMADPAYPAGMKESGAFGRSSNQQFLALPGDAAIRPDDFAFLRPTQSEAVLQQFGPIRILSQGRIVDAWPVLPPE